jgi:methylmalonyl-CoA mutase cobalamin-binding subunit
MGAPPADCSWWAPARQLATVTASMAIRRPHKAVILLSAAARTGDRVALALAESLRELGVDTIYLGREDSVSRIVEVVAEEGADAVEVCVEGPYGIRLLRDLLRELNRVGHRDVSIVVHKVH